MGSIYLKFEIESELHEFKTEHNLKSYSKTVKFLMDEYIKNKGSEKN